MKVVELIDILKKYPDDMEVVARIATKTNPYQYVEEQEEVGFSVWEERDNKIAIDVEGVYFH